MKTKLTIEILVVTAAIGIVYVKEKKTKKIFSEELNRGLVEEFKKLDSKFGN